MISPAVVFLFGVVVLGMFGAVSGLLATPMAIGLSYVPYVLYALAMKRPKYRPLRQFGVFAVTWAIATGVLAFVSLANSDFSAAGGAITAFGIDIFSPWVLIPPAVAIVPVLLGGELALFLLRKRIPPEPAEP